MGPRARKCTTLLAFAAFIFVTIAALVTPEGPVIQVPWLVAAILVSAIYQIGNALGCQVMTFFY